MYKAVDGFIIINLLLYDCKTITKCHDFDSRTTFVVGASDVIFKVVITLTFSTYLVYCVKPVVRFHIETRH